MTFRATWGVFLMQSTKMLRRWSSLPLGDGSPIDSLIGVVERVNTATVALDSAGRIVAANDAWFRAAELRGASAASVGLGVDYLAVCDRTEGPDREIARRSADGIRAVLSGESPQFSLDYECSSGGDERWYALRVSPIATNEVGVLVTHLEITSVRLAEHAVRGQFDHLWTVADAGADFVALVDADGTIVHAVPDGIGAVRWRGRPALDTVHPHDRDALTAAFERCVAVPGRRTSIAVRVECEEGRWRRVECRAVNLLDDRLVQGVVISGRDVTRRARDQAMQVLWRSIVDQLPAGVAVIDEAGVVVAWNDQADRIMGLDGEDVVGRSIDDLLQMDDRRAAIQRDLDLHGIWEGPYELMREGSRHSLWLKLESIDQGPGGVRGLIAVASDRTEHEQMRDALAHVACHDGLTGLLNRRCFLDHVADVTARTSGNDVVAVVKLDRFRKVNAAHGANRGDDVLREVGRVLEQAVGADGTVARLFGDVFALAVPLDAWAAGLSQRLFETLSEIAIDGAPLLLQASVGLRVVGAGDEAETVLDDAFAAAGDVKDAGGNGACFFERELREALADRAALQRDLLLAIRHGELDVHYQPVVRIADGVVVGAEALVRWVHPTRGRIDPASLVSIAEESGWIGEIGAFVLNDACHQARRWWDLRPELPMRISVNLSPMQLRDPGLVGAVAAAVSGAGIDPSLITLELTESMLMDEDLAVRGRLSELRAMGVRLSLDDFGTGYSSLSQLTSLPLDVVKIDRSFVQAIGRRPEATSVVKTILNLADALGLEVVAEGVETTLDRDELAANGCVYGQGFLWSCAIEADAIDELLTHTFDPAAAPRSITDAVAACEGFSDALRAVHHELSSPLSVIAGHVDRLECPDGDGSSVRTIRRNLRRVNKILESLDIVEQLDRGRLSIRPEPTDLVELVEQVADEIAARHGRQVHVRSDIPVRAMIDPPLIEQVVSNLLTNAAKYSPAYTSIEVMVSASACRAQLTVVDQGPGIPDDRIGLAWRKFGRVDRTLPGTGIGLYLSRGIVRAHGGDMTYRAGVPTGAIFIVEVPEANA